MKKYNYIVSVVMLLLSGYIFYESGGYTIGSSAQKNPAVWPCILAGALALLSVALIIETARLLWRPRTQVLAGLPALRARRAALLRERNPSGFAPAGALLANWCDEQRPA